MTDFFVSVSILVIFVSFLGILIGIERHIEREQERVRRLLDCIVERERRRENYGKSEN